MFKGYQTRPFKPLRPSGNKPSQKLPTFKPKTWNSLPPELVLHIFKLARRSYLDPWTSQIQLHNFALINRAAYYVAAAEIWSSFVARGFKTLRRLARVMNQEPSRTVRARCLVVDLVREERPGSLHMIQELLVRAATFKDVTLLLKGKEGHHNTVVVPADVWGALRAMNLQGFELRFNNDQTTVTLGGELAKTLTTHHKLKRLSLPHLLVPKVGFSFTFSPSLTSLSLHLADAGSFSLLEHLIGSSTLTLRHLRLTIHKTFTLTSELQQALLPIAPSLRSLEIWTAVPPPRDRISTLPQRYTPISLVEVYPRLEKVTSLALAGELVGSLPPPMPSLRHLDFLCGPFNTFERQIGDWLVDMRDDHTKLVPSLRLLGRSLGPQWIDQSLKAVADEAGVALWFEDDLGGAEEDDESDYESAY